MSYAQLKAFHALALEGSIQKASERIHVTQPAVSIQIKRLESDHSKSLFRRSGHLFQLTRDGQMLFDATRRLFRAESDARLLLSSSAPQFCGTLIIGSDGPHAVLDLIEEFRNQHPQIRIEVVLKNAQETWGKLLDLEVDVAVLAGSPDHPGVIKNILYRQSPIALIPTDHALSKRRTISLKELAKFPLLFRERGSHTQTIIEGAMHAKDISIEPLMTLGSREAVVEAVVREIGIGFVFEREVGQDARYRPIPISEIEEINTDELVCLRDQMNNPFVKALFSCIESDSG